MKKILSVAMAAAMVMSLAACQPAATPAPASEAPASEAPADDTAVSEVPASEAPVADAGTLYYLNFKPEIADVYTRIGEAYKAETGVTLKVETAASGTYEQTLKSEMAKSEPPALFQINGPRGYAAWKDYCKDLSQTSLYNALADKSLAVTGSDGGVYGIPYVVEGYGIIYNNAIMTKYFALPDKAVTISSADEIKDFATLKAVVEDMTAHTADLGIEGVFASTSLSPGNDWRWQTHLANIPVFWEFKNNNIDLTSDATKEITFEYDKNFQNLFDLYTNNSLTAKGLLGAKSVDDSMAEFALGRCAMVQNGNWAWSQISGVDGNTVLESDIKFMPLYTGVEGESAYGICVGTENFFAVNSQAPAEQQKLAEDFIYWLYSSDTGKAFVTNELNFIAPFTTFTDAERPTDPLAKEVVRWMSTDGVTSIPWNFTVFPNQTFKDAFGGALLEYVQGTKTWEDVKTLVVNDWKTQSAIVAE